MIFKKLFAVIIAIITIASFSACARDGSSASPENNNNTSSEPETTMSETTVSSSSVVAQASTPPSYSNITEEEAKEIFLSHFPEAPIDIIKLEDDGTIYYIQGIKDNIKYIMKIRVSDGSIIMSKKININ